MCDEIDEQHELLMRAIEESIEWDNAEQAQYEDDIYEARWSAIKLYGKSQ